MENQEQDSDKKKKESSELSRYSGIAFQMIAIIMIAVFAGFKLDQWIKAIEFPVFLVSFTIVGVILSMIYTIRDFIKK